MNLRKEDCKFAVVLDSSRFTFSANHLLAFSSRNGYGARQQICDLIEDLHGHDFRVSVRIEGPLNPNDSCVISFIDASNALLSVLEYLDHKTILGANSQLVQCARRSTTVMGGEIDLSWSSGNRDFVWKLPEADCLLLENAANPSTEEIAYFILDKFIEKIDAERLLAHKLTNYYFRLTLYESPGCSVEVAF